MKHIVVAYDQNRAIGNKNGLPWEMMPADMRHFRELTLGKTAVGSAMNAIIMGRTTYDSIGHPLPKRQNIVMSRQEDLKIDGCTVVRSLEEAYDTAQSAEDIFVIGGEQVFREALPTVDLLHVTKIDASLEGDTYFPEINMEEWALLDEEAHVADEKNRYDYRFLTYGRRKESEAYVNLDNARSDDQRRTMERIVEDRVCPFCTENLSHYHQQEILKESSSWLLTPNQWPYEHTSVHLLAIAKRHAESLKDLEPSDFAELLELFQWAEKEYGIESGGVAMRFGDVVNNGASVRHLHAHFIAPSKDRPADHKIKFKIS